MSTQSQKRPDPFLNAGAIRAATFVRHTEIRDTLGSTNDRAAELAREMDIELPALVVARYQTAGRGRGQNQWWSADGALTFSVLLDTIALGIRAANWPQLSLATAVAVCDALQTELDACFNPKSEIRNPKLRLGIKWPNDVVLDGRKICGILIESPGGAAPAKERLIVGVGVNVNNSWQTAQQHASGATGFNGVALCDVTGRRHTLSAILAAVLTALASRFREVQSRDPSLHQAWQKLDWLAGQRVVLEADGRSIEGVCLRIGDDGALILQTASGPQRFFSGTVRCI